MSTLVKEKIINPIVMLLKYREVSKNRIEFIASRYGKKALQNDWENIGRDIKKVMQSYNVR